MQFAYNEMSLFLVRLLQNFDRIILDTNAQPLRATSLLEWKTRRREVERDLLAVHLTLSTKVSSGPYTFRFLLNLLMAGRSMGADEQCMPPWIKQGFKLSECRTYLFTEPANVCS